MPVRHLIALAAAASCLAVPAASAATGPVTTSRLGAVQLELAGEDGASVVLRIRVQDAIGGDVVHVQRTVCQSDGCSYPDYFEDVLDEGTAELDGAAAAGTARLLLDGRAVEVTWSPDPQAGAVVGGVEGGGDDASTVFGTYVAEPALARVTVAGTTCTDGDAAVGDGLRVAVPEDGRGAARPLSALRLGGAQPVCAQPGS